MEITPEDEKAIKQTMAEMFPGRSISELSQQEVDRLFEAYDSRRAVAESMYTSPDPQGKTVGPSGIYVAPNPWESVANAAVKVGGGALLGKVNRDEAQGRRLAADIATREDFTERQDEIRRAQDAERERRDWITTILGRSYQ
jgi:hypothetical protein